MKTMSGFEERKSVRDLRFNTRDKFLLAYAKTLCDHLNNFLEDSGFYVGTPYIEASAISRMRLLHCQEMAIHAARLVRVECVPECNEVISYDEKYIYITKPSATLEDIKGWSNVEAWIDAGIIISSVLSARIQEP